MFFALRLLFLIIIVESCRTINGNEEELIEKLQNDLAAWKSLSSPFYKEQNFYKEKYTDNKTYEDVAEFDFIVIGSGAAGSIIASRLSEEKNWKILLLEAGPEENELVNMPGSYPYLINTQFDWGYNTVPQKHACLSAENAQCVVRAGKGLGGGTLVNGIYYTHGHPEDYNQWEALGNDGWSWKDVFPFLKKPENINYVKFADLKYHGKGGNLFIEDFPYYTNISNNVLLAAKELSIPIGDFNAAGKIVYGVPYGTIHNGKRFTVARGYLNNIVRRRANIVIKTQSQVTKIIINKQTLEAEGVEYLQYEDLKVARVNKEVIVSAGALNTPKILMLSGIGPRKHLESVEIEPILNLPVGYNLNNHLSFWGLSYTFNESIVKAQTEYESIKNYINCKGPFTSIGLDAVGYYKSKQFNIERNTPNIEFQFSTRQGGIKGWSKANQTNLVIQINILHPLSRGTITLQDSDPLHYPKIDTNYLSDPRDVEMILEGIHRAIEFMNTTVMQALGPVLIPLDVPACNNFTHDDFWRCVIRYNTASLSHYSGSSKMGPKSDKTAVVDPQLRIHGCKKLRVADGSIIPVTMSGHLMSPVNMIGEKAAVIIKNTWK